MLGKTLVAVGKLRIGIEQVLQIAMQETIAPHAVEYFQQVITLVFDRWQTPARWTQKGIYQRFIFAEQFGDDRLLVGEVVVQITRRNLHVRSDVIGAHTALALQIEQ